MSSDTHDPTISDSLRKRAEEFLRTSGADSAMEMAQSDPARLVEELRLHMAELEIQNEELREVRNSLENSNRRFSELFLFAPTGYLLLDEQGRIADVNLVGADLLGRERGFILRHPVSAFVVGEHQAEFARFRHLVLERDRRGVCEIRMNRRDESPFWARIDAAPFPGEDGACLLSVTDVSRRITAEQELREKTALSEMILSSLPYAAMLIHPDGEVVAANRAAADMGFVRSGNCRNCFAHDGDDCSWCLLDEAMRTEERQRIEVDRGVRRYVHEWIPLPPDLCLCTLLDITDRYEMESALRRSENLLAGVFGAVDVGVCVTDEEGRFVRVNRSYCDMYGYDEKELLGRSFDMVVPEELREEARRLHDAFIGDGSEMPREWTLRRRDGSHFVGEVNAALLRHEDGRRLKVTVVTDVTDRKRMEQMALHSERMAAAELVAGGVAHHFNNLNTGILGYLELVLLDESVPAQARERIERVMRTAEEMSSLTDHLLLFSGASPDMPMSLRLDELARQSVELMLPVLQGEHVRVDTEFEETPPVTADRAQMGQVVTNLLFNARDALLRVDGPRRIRVETGTDGNEVFVRVSDSGPGIPDEAQRRIFLPFVSGDEDTGPEPSGRAPPKRAGHRNAGLGLSVCNTIVRDHGGHIVVESEPGRGSAFIVRLPVSESAPDDEADASRPVGGDLAGRRVLIAEDETVLREALVEMLQEAGCVVTAVAAADEAVAALLDAPCDALVLDVVMPRGGAAAVLRHLEDRDPSERPGVLVMTGNLRFGDNNGFAEDFDGEFLCKPFRNERFLERLRAVVAARDARDARTD